MNKFPDSLNAQSCANMRLQNEYALVEYTRQQFCSIIEQNMNDINRDPIRLIFDKRLSSDFKKGITGELLERFYKIKVTYSSPDSLVGSKISRYIKTGGDIPENILSVEIAI